MHGAAAGMPEVYHWGLHSHRLDIMMCMSGMAPDESALLSAMQDVGSGRQMRPSIDWETHAWRCCEIASSLLLLRK